LPTACTNPVNGENVFANRILFNAPENLLRGDKGRWWVVGQRSSAVQHNITHSNNIMDRRIIVFGRNINTTGANFTGFCLRVQITFIVPGVYSSYSNNDNTTGSHTFGWAQYYIKRRRGDGMVCRGSVHVQQKITKRRGTCTSVGGIYNTILCIYI